MVELHAHTGMCTPKRTPLPSSLFLYLGRLGALADLPAADLLGPAGEEVDEVHRAEAGDDDFGQGGDALVLLAVGRLFVVGHVEELGLQRAGEGDELAAAVAVDPLHQLGQPLVLLTDVVALGEVYQVDHGLGRDELLVVQELGLHHRPVAQADVLALLQPLQRLLRRRELLLLLLVQAPERLGDGVVLPMSNIPALLSKPSLHRPLLRTWGCSS